MKNLVKITLAAVLLSNCAYAGFKEHYELGQQYLSTFQYSGAITEFKNAMRINYMDNSARIGLINSYIARATYFANKEKNYQKAADDYRSALFYMQYYPQQSSSAQYIPQITSNLNVCLRQSNFDTSAANRFATAKQLRAEGNFSAAAYEFNQTLADRSLQKESFEQVGDIMKLLGNKQKAAEYYRRAVAVSPTDIQLRLSYAKMLDELGQDEAAVTEYNYILGKTTDNKDLLYSLERIYKKKLEVLKDIPGTETDLWREFISKGIEYKENNLTEERCPFCHQNLSEHAKNIVDAYVLFLQDKSQIELGHVEMTLKQDYLLSARGMPSLKLIRISGKRKYMIT